MVRKFSTILPLVFFFSAISAFAQSPRDSLMEVYRYGEGTGKFEAMLRLAESYMSDSVSFSVQLCEEVLQEAQKKDEIRYKIMAYDLMGRGYVYQGQNVIAADLFEKALRYSKETEYLDHYGHLVNSLGVLYQQIGRYEDALFNLLESKKWWEDHEDELRLTYTLINLGNLQIQLNKLDQAKPVLEECLANSLRLNILNLVVMSYNGLGSIQEIRENYHQAMELYEKAYNFQQENNLPASLAISSLGNIHNILIEQGQDGRAQQYYLKALGLAEETQQQPVLQRLLKQRADAFLKRGSLDQAIELYLQSLNSAEKMGLKKEAEEIYAQLTKCYETKGDFQTALFFHERFAEMRHERYEEVSSQRIHELQTRYQLEEMEASIQSLQEEKKRQQTQNLILLLVITAVSIALIALYSRYQYKQRAEKVLTDRNVEIEKQNKIILRRSKEILNQNHLLEGQSGKIKLQNRKLTEVNEELEQLAYAVSHDLREPLRTINSYQGLLIRRYEDKLDDAGKEFLRYAADGTNRLQALVTDMLDYSRLGRNTAPQESVDLNDLMDQLYQHIRPAVKEKNGSINIEHLPTVLGRGTELFLLFQNLISNSLKFAHPERPPRINISYEKKGANYQIRVEDNGIGIPMSEKERIFRIFYRYGDNGQPGTGVGLAICKKVVRNHDGTIEVSSKMDQGSTFIVTLPTDGVTRKTLGPEA